MMALHIMAVDRLYANSVETTNGGVFVLTLNLKSDTPMCGFECVIDLPEGVTAVTDSFGDLVYDLGSRTNSKRHVISCVNNGNNSVKMLCYSNTALPFADLDGDVATITLKANENMKEGNYTINLTGIVLSSPDDKTLYPSDESFTLTVKDQLACVVKPYISTSSNSPLYNVIGQRVSTPRGLVVSKGKTLNLKP